MFDFQNDQNTFCDIPLIFSGTTVQSNMVSIGFLKAYIVEILIIIYECICAHSKSKKFGKTCYKYLQIIKKKNCDSGFNRPIDTIRNVYITFLKGQTKTRLHTTKHKRFRKKKRFPLPGYDS